MSDVWVTRDGRQINIRDMEDDHLLATIRMLRRNYRRNCWAWSIAADGYAMDAPCGASLAAEAEARELMDEGEHQVRIQDKVYHFKELVDELHRRGITEITWR